MVATVSGWILRGFAEHAIWQSRVAQLSALKKGLLRLAAQASAEFASPEPAERPSCLQGWAQRLGRWSSTLGPGVPASAHDRVCHGQRFEGVEAGNDGHGQRLRPACPPEITNSRQASQESR